MATDETPDDESGFGETQITVVVVPGRVRATFTKLRAGAPGRAVLASVALIAAAAAGTIIAVSSSAGRAGRPLRTYAPRLADSDAVASRFGVRVNCPRLTVVSPGGAYARVDFQDTAPCGVFGNHITLILHRVHDVWVRELEASGWTCPMSRLPQRVVTELQLCLRPVLTPRPAALSGSSP
jgi:hypothetical protein